MAKTKAETVAGRARAAGDMPRVKRWIARFRRLAQDMPPEVEVLVGGEGVAPYVLAIDGTGCSVKQVPGHPAKIDPGAVITQIAAGRWHGETVVGDHSRARKALSMTMPRGGKRSRS
jgi:hypothetical protein